eukprot:COSAG02_NODE_1464_length_12487_cov_122.573297_1_plen_82_part_00
MLRPFALISEEQQETRLSELDAQIAQLRSRIDDEESLAQEMGGAGLLYVPGAASAAAAARLNGRSSWVAVGRILGSRAGRI